MKGHKLLALLLALLLCVQLLPVSTAFAAEVSEDGVSVTLKANDVEYGTVTSGSKLTGLGNGDTVELTATPKAGSNVTFSKWVVFKGDEGTASATEGMDYTLTEAVSGSGKATLTVLDTTENLRVLAVFQGKIVGLKNQNQEFAPIPAQSGQNWIIQVNGGSSAAGTTKITGWNNDPKETLLVTTTFTTAPGDTDLETLTLQVWKKLNGVPMFPNVLATGASYKFDNLTSVADTAGYTGYRFPGEGWDWTEYDFSIVGSDGKVLKPGKLVFRYPGIAVIEAENGKVKCGDVTYENGATAKLGTGEQTIEAVADEGYVFTGWEISGVEMSNTTVNPLTFTMPTGASTTIKAKFAKTVSVTLKANDDEYGTVKSGSKLTGLGNGDTVELTATPKAGSNVTFSKWVVFKGDEGTTSATEGTDYTLTEAVSGSGKATLTVLGTTENLRVLAVFQGKIVGLKNQVNEFAPIPAKMGNSWIIQVRSGVNAVGTTEVTGWNNDPKETLLVTTTFTAVPGETDRETLTLQAWKKLSGRALPMFPDVLASGASYKFDNLTEDSSNSNAGLTAYRFPEGWDWTEYNFSIVDSDGKVLKPGKLVFRYPGIAVIEAENGKVKCGDVTYENGATAKLGTGNQTIEAVADEGYVFTGWEIDGVTPDNATTNPLTFTMPTEASTIIKAKFAKKAGTPELGYQLSIEGSGKVFVDGVELANGYIAEVADKTSVKFLAEPDEGYVLDHWELSSPNGGSYSNSSGNLKTVFITKNYGDKFYNVKAVFVQRDTYKLRFNLMLGEKDVTLGDEFKAVCKNQGYGIPYIAYSFPSTTSLDEIYSSLSTSATMSGFTFNSGLNYLDFPVDSDDWIVIGLNQYPGYTEQGGPQFIADGFESSNKSAVADMRSIPHLRFDGRTYIVFKMTKDTTITAKIHEMQYSTITVPTNEAEGTVTITPNADFSPNLWWEGTQLTVQAAPAEGYRFVRWQESTGGYINDENAVQNPLNITLGETGANFSPVFEAAEAFDRIITKVVDPEGKATITINGSSDTIQVREGSVVSLGIDVDEYYLFDHWNVTQNGVEPSYNLVAPENQKSENATFVMPFGESSVTVQAVLKNRYTGLSTLVFLMTGNNGTTAGTKGLTTVSLSKNGTPLTDVNCQVQKGDELEIAVTMLNDEYVLREIVVENMDSHKAIQTITDAQGTITIPSWNSWRIAVRIEKKTEDTARHSISLTQPTTGGTISSSNTTSQPDKTITLTAVPKSGYTLKSWIVKDEQQKTISVITDNNVGTFTMPKSDVTVTAEFVALAEVKPEITSVALLQGEAGDELATGVPSGDKWTITIPDTVPAETVAKIPEGLSGLYLKIVTPAGVTVKQGQFEGDWSQGDIMCYMPVNEEVTFQAIAGTATKNYTIKLVYSGSPLLSNGSATRTSKTAATVKFTSSEAGNYFYKVVDHGAAAPTVDTSKNGTSAVQGENTITLSNLGDGARDIYIVVVSAAGGESAPLKVEIPAYGGTETPDEGDFSIYVSTPKGGTITTNRTKANEGDEIIVTVTPDSGYQMVEGSLCYGFAKGGAPMDKVITNNRFKMPAGDINITCQWETATTTAKGITSFSINGVAGAVNNTTNTITITMPRGTDVTKLTPVIATNGVKSLTPGSGETVDFTNSVTYTAAMEDGSTKTYTVTVYVDKGTLADQFWDKLTDFATQVPWWEYAKHQQSTSKYPKYW